MKQTTIGKHLLTILLSLVMACALCVPAMAEEETFARKTAADFLGMANSNIITLNENVEITDILENSNNLTIDLNGHTLKLDVNDNKFAKDNAQVELKNGTLSLPSNIGGTYGPVWVGVDKASQSSLTLEGVTVTGNSVTAPCGIFNVFGNSTLRINNSSVDIIGISFTGYTDALIYCNEGTAGKVDIANSTIKVQDGWNGIYSGTVSINKSDIDMSLSDRGLCNSFGWMALTASDSGIKLATTNHAIRMLGTSNASFKDCKLDLSSSKGPALGFYYKSDDNEKKTGHITFQGACQVTLSGTTIVEDGAKGNNTASVPMENISKYVTIPEGSSWYEKDGKWVLCNHDATLVSGQKEATCTEKGYSGDTVCTVCGKTVAAGQEIDINPNNHDLKLVEAVAATTETEGVLAHYECSACNKWYWDDAGKNPIASQNAVVTAKLTSQTEELNSEVGKPEETFTVTAEGSVASVAVKIDTDKLMENTADTMATVDTSVELKNKAVEELAKQNVTATAEEVTLILTPAVEVENVKVDEQKATITMDISLVCKVEAKARGAVVPVAKETVPNDQIKQDTVITMSVPASWNGKSIIVRHVTKSRGVKFYSAVAANGVATFTVPAEDGFSPFTLFVDDGKTVTVKLDNETKTYNRTDVVNETALPAASKYNYAFKGWKFEGVDGQHFNMTAELFEALLDKNAVVIGSSVFEGPMSEHPEIEEAKKNGTWGVDENKPAATAKPAAAAAVTPVRSSIPKTSDDSNLMLWVCLMGLAALGLGGALYLKKRGNK